MNRGLVRHRYHACCTAGAAAWGLDGVAIDDDDALLARPDVDLVEILLPHHLHLDAALKAIDAGKIVSPQKPMCISMAQADRLVAAAEASDRPFKVFENFMFYPPVMRARRLVEAGAIGRPLSIRIKSNPGRSATAWEVPQSAIAWRQRREQSGGGPMVLGLMRQGVTKYLAVFGHGSTASGDVLRVYEHHGLVRWRDAGVSVTHPLPCVSARPFHPRVPRKRPSAPATRAPQAPSRPIPRSR